MGINDAWKALQSMLEGMLETCRMLESAEVLDMMVGLWSKSWLRLTTVSDAFEAPSATSTITEQECLRSVTKCGKA